MQYRPRVPYREYGADVLDGSSDEYHITSVQLNTRWRLRREEIVKDRLEKLVQSALLLELAAVLALLLARGFKSVVSEDITFYDETSYLAQGLSAALGRWPKFTDGATYSDMYFLLSNFTTDPVGLYFAGRAVGAVAFVLGVWLSARILSTPLLAWAAAATVAALPLSSSWPGVSGPAAGAICVAVAIALRFPGSAGLGISTGLVWLAAASRPEFIWFAVFSSCASILLVTWAAFQRRMRTSAMSRSVAAVTAGAVVVPGMLIYLHGWPVSAAGRDWIAFAQHFSLRNVTWGEDPWLNALVVTERSFPGADSIFAAVMVNPAVFAGHAAKNLLDLPRALMNGLGQPPAGSMLVGGLMLMFLALGLVVSVAVDSRGAKERLRGLSRLFRRSPYLWVGLWLGALLFALMLPLVIIYPREHYLLVPGGLVVVALVSAQRYIGNPQWSAFIPGLLILACFAAFSALAVQQAIARTAIPAPLASAAIQLRVAETPWRLLGVDWGLEVYVPGLVQLGGEGVRPGTTFGEFLSKESVNAVLINDRFTQAEWSRLPGFAEFLEDPNTSGFFEVVPGSGVWTRRSR